MQAKPFGVIKKIYAIIISLFLIIVLFIIVIVPIVSDTKKAYAKFSELKEEVLRLIQAGSTSKTIESQLKTHDKDIHRLHSGVIVGGKEVEFIEFLESVARAHSIKQNFQIAEPDVRKESLNTYTPFIISIKGEGASKDVLAYLAALESGPYYINITTFTLGKIESPPVQKRVLDAPSPLSPPISVSELLDSTQESRERKTTLSLQFQATVFLYTASQ